MNNDIICICYSRTGKTRKAMREISGALDCQLIEVRDRIRRGGAIGALRCGLDAMRRRTWAITKFETERPLWEYKLVILGTPVWGGRCSSVMRGLLKRRGYEMSNVAYVITHKTEERYTEIFDQMDQYVLKPHVAAVSLCPGSTGYHFWRRQFLKQCAEFAGVELVLTDEDEAAEANHEAAASDRPQDGKMIAENMDTEH
ncbi:MAG: hypothetical protein J5449_09575 [Oscillospiraceae bacterium]|nr:hypothetical protein [Oscillospiraceae bacterium]